MSKGACLRRESRSLAGEILLVVGLTVAISCTRCTAASTFGSWTCTQTAAGRSPSLISRGDFSSLTFMPFLSPFVSQEECFAQRYLGDVECVYTVSAPVGHVIYGEFISFRLDTDCAKDFVRVQQLDIPLSGEVATDMTFCGTKTGQYFAVVGQDLIMRFKTDPFHSCEGFSGFFTVFKPSILLGRSNWLYSASSNSNSNSFSDNLVNGATYDPALYADSKTLSKATRSYGFLLLSLNRARINRVLSLQNYCDALRRACAGLFGIAGACIERSCYQLEPLRRKRNLSALSTRYISQLESIGNASSIPSVRRMRRSTKCTCRY
eukprot:scpid68244/ scgid9343/ 